MSFAAVLAKFQELQNPFPGLRYFDTRESHLFFGRDRQVAELVERLSRRRLVAVVGLSGCGKSSLVRAGLIPVLRSGPISEANALWRVVVTRPAGAPFSSLADALRTQGLDPANLRRTSHGLIEVARQLAHDETLLVIVDQFEELFRYKEHEAATDAKIGREEAASEAADFVQLLLAATRHQPPIYVVLTMRSDYLGDCAEFRDFPEALNQCQYLVPRLTREQRKEAIEGPLGRVDIAPSLIQRILNDAGDEPDQLPVLQHALMRTWEFASERWKTLPPGKPHTIELKDYRAAGTFSSALDNHANELLDTVNQQIAEKIFRRLTKRAADHRERRDPATLQELWDLCDAHTPEAQQDVCAVLDRFRQSSATFLLPSADQVPTLAPDRYIDITHESLIRQWGKMREWMAREAELCTNYLRLLDDALSNQGGGANLWSDPELALALGWWQSEKPTAAWASRYVREPGKGPAEFQTATEFLEKSRLARDAAARREVSRRRAQFWTLFGVAVFALTAAVVVSFMLIRVRREQHRSLAGKLLAESLASHGKTSNDVQSSVLLAAASLLYQPPGESIAMNLYALERALSLLPKRLARVETNGPVLTVDISRDGNYVALGTWSGSVRVLKLEENKLKPLWTDEPGSAIRSAVFSRDAKFLATGDDDGNVRIYQVDSPRAKELHKYEHSTGIWRLAVSPDGTLASANEDKTATLLDPTSGAQITLPHDGQVQALAFDPDGNYLATASEDRTLRLFRKDGTLVWPAGRTPAKQGGPVWALAFSPDGKFIVTGGDDGTVRLYRSRDGKELNVWPHSRGVRTVAFSPNGKYVAYGSDDATARVLDLTTGVEISRMTHRAAVSLVAFNSNGRYIVTGSDDWTARLFEAASGREVLRQSHKDAVLSLALSADDRYLVTGSYDTTAALWDIRDRSELASAPLSRPETVAVMTPTYNGRYLATVSPDGHTRVLDLQTSATLVDVGPPRLLHTTFNTVGISAKAEFVAVAGAAGWAVLDIARRSWIHSIPASSLSTLDLSPDGRSLAVAEAFGLNVIDVKTAQVRWHKDLPMTPSQVAFNAAGDLIAAAGQEDTVRIFAANGDPFASFDHPFKDPETCKDRRWSPCNVTALAFSASGKFLAMGTSDNIARIYDVAGKRQIRSFIPNASVHALVFSADDKYLASSGENLDGQVFDTRSGEQLSNFDLENGDFFPLAFSADDRYILSASDLGSLRVTQRLWRRDDYLQETCVRAGDSIPADEWKKYSNDDPPKICAPRN